MSHFSDEDWLHFIRHLVPETETAEMARHLEEDCEECRGCGDFDKRSM